MYFLLNRGPTSM